VPQVPLGGLFIGVTHPQCQGLHDRRTLEIESGHGFRLLSFPNISNTHKSTLLEHILSRCLPLEVVMQTTDFQHGGHLS
jgi:hypothetical protein